MGWYWSGFKCRIIEYSLYIDYILFNICLRFLGNYGELDGGLFENAALFISGGIHDEYNTFQVKLRTENEIKLAEVPTMDELFDIIRIALEKKDMIGCSIENVIHIFTNIKNAK